MSADRFSTRIESLDPESRAIVELAIGRGFSDEELAGMLGTTAESVGERRERALDHLGARTARDREAVAGALASAPRGNGTEPAAADAAATEPGDPAEPAPPSAARGERAPRRRALVMAIVGGVLIAVTIGITLAMGGGEAEPEPISAGQGEQGEAPAGEGEAPPAGEEEPAEEAPPAEDEPPPDDGEGPPAGDGDAVRLEPPAGGEATGTVELLPAEGDRGRRLLLTVRGLGPARRAGGYGIWLYDSVSRARMIAGSPRGTFRAQVRLPPQADRYRFLDVSYEPPDGNRNHSGASLLRVPLDEVLGG